MGRIYVLDDELEHDVAANAANAARAVLPEVLDDAKLLEALVTVRQMVS